MPQRHSKNNNDAAVFSRHERQAAGYGSVSARLGTDSQLPFGYCCLTLKPAVDPVISPSGHMYSREAIIEYLLTKTQDIKRQKALWEAQQSAKDEEAQAQAVEEHEKDARRFIDKQTSASAAVAASVALNGRGKKSEEEERKERYIAEYGSKIDTTTREARRHDLKRTSFWLPQCAPEVKDQGVDRPEKRPRSPMSGDPLRTKDLMPVDIKVDPDWTDDRAAEGRGKFLCAVSLKSITNQSAVFIKSTGVVMLEKVYEEYAKPTMVCPITSKPFKESDVIKIQSGGTGFAASGKVEVKKYRPTRF